ncbi:hypothetical protein ACOSP7_022123 [Xanthoceras sorbifolium]
MRKQLGESFKKKLMSMASSKSWTGFGAGKEKLKIAEGNITVLEEPTSDKERGRNRFGKGSKIGGDSGSEGVPSQAKNDGVRVPQEDAHVQPKATVDSVVVDPQHSQPSEPDQCGGAASVSLTYADLMVLEGTVSKNLQDEGSAGVESMGTGHSVVLDQRRSQLEVEEISSPKRRKWKRLARAKSGWWIMTI